MILWDTITETAFIDMILKKWKPKCRLCEREMLPIGPRESFCNFDPCKVWNKPISFEMNILYNIPEEKEKVSETMKSKRKGL